MTVTVNLPRTVEQAYEAADRSKGVSLDALVADILVSHMPEVEPTEHPELLEEHGIPVLHSGQPIDPSVVDEVIDLIRRERELSALGLLYRD